MSWTVNTRGETSSPAKSTSGLRTYGSPPSSGERTLSPPDSTSLKEGVDYEHTDLGDARMAAAEDKRLVAAENAPIAAAETDSAQASPPPAA